MGRPSFAGSLPGAAPGETRGSNWCSIPWEWGGPVRRAQPDLRRPETGRPPAIRPNEGAEPPTSDRQPPQGLTAEQSVLGGMLLSKDAIADVVEILPPDDFSRPAHQTVYDCILDLYG